MLIARSYAVAYKSPPPITTKTSQVVSSGSVNMWQVIFSKTRGFLYAKFCSEFSDVICSNYEATIWNRTSSFFLHFPPRPVPFCQLIPALFSLPAPFIPFHFSSFSPPFLLPSLCFSLNTLFTPFFPSFYVLFSILIFTEPPKEHAEKNSISCARDYSFLIIACCRFSCIGSA